MTIPVTLTPELAQWLGELVDLAAEQPRARGDGRRLQDMRSLARKVRGGTSDLEGRYTKPFDHLGDLIPVDQFLEGVAANFFTDDDGFGHPVKDGLVDEKTRISPEDLNIPKDATHVVWFNK